MRDEEIKKLIVEARTEPSPGRLSEIAVLLTTYYASLSEEIKDILIKKADEWIKLRVDHGSDRSTDRTWDATDDGKSEIKLRFQLKYVEKIISVIKLRLRILEGESRGQY